MEGPAIDTIATLPGPFDLVFIDADKSAYPAYYEAVLPKLAPRGIIAADNTLWSGRILDPVGHQRRTRWRCGRSTTSWPTDPRVVAVQTTVRDGVTLDPPGRLSPAPPPPHLRPPARRPAPKGSTTSVLDYHLHLWPHSQSDAQTTVEQVAAYCERAAARGVTEIAVTEHLFRFTQAKDRLGGFWDDLPGDAAAPGHGRLLGPPRPGRPRRLRRGGRGRQGRRAAGRARPRGRLLPGPDGRRRRPPRRATRSTSCSAPCTGSARGASTC